MEKYLYILAFFVGVILVFVIGNIIGRLFKLDKHLKDNEHDNK